MEEIQIGGTPERLNYAKKPSSEAEKAVLFHHLLPYQLGEIEELCDHFSFPYPGDFERVVDFGCGNGWGANLLFKAGLEVIGYDIDPIVIEENNARFPNGPKFTDNLEEVGGSAPQFVVAYQSLEHADDHVMFLREVKIASSGGIAIIITPDRRERLLPGQRPWNRFHTFEHDPGSLTKCVEEITSSYSIGVVRFRDEDTAERLRTRRLRIILSPILWLPSSLLGPILKGIDKFRRCLRKLRAPTAASVGGGKDYMPEVAPELDIKDVFPGLIGNPAEKGINLVAVLDFREMI